MEDKPFRNFGETFQIRSLSGTPTWVRMLEYKTEKGRRTYLIAPTNDLWNEGWWMNEDDLKERTVGSE